MIYTYINYTHTLAKEFIFLKSAVKGSTMRLQLRSKINSLQADWGREGQSFKALSTPKYDINFIF